MRDFFRHRTGERLFARCGHDLSDRPGPRFSAVPLRSSCRSPANRCRRRTRASRPAMLMPGGCGWCARSRTWGCSICTGSASGDAEGVSGRHHRDARRIRPRECPRQTQPNVMRPGHHASARTRHCAQPRSTPDQKTRVSTMTRSGVDGGEHSATLDRVMAGALFSDARGRRCRSSS